MGAQSVMQGYERTGSVYERLAIGTGDAARCEALCDGDHAPGLGLDATGYYDENARTPALLAINAKTGAGATTGLSPRLTRQIEASPIARRRHGRSSPCRRWMTAPTPDFPNTYNLNYRPYGFTGLGECETDVEE